jgi:hypothetical protein
MNSPSHTSLPSPPRHLISLLAKQILRRRNSEAKQHEVTASLVCPLRDELAEGGEWGGGSGAVWGGRSRAKRAVFKNSIKLWKRGLMGDGCGWDEYTGRRRKPVSVWSHT